MAETVPPTHTVTELLEQVKADQRQRWAEGRPLRVEDYLEQHPALAGRADDILDLIDNEAVQRRRAGETPQPEDYFSRFPHLADELKLWFGIDELLSELPTPLPPPSPVVCPRCAAAAGQGDTCPGCGATLPGRATVCGTEASEPPAVPGYEVLGKLGRGGMGIVFRARHLALERDVALKTLLPEALAAPGLRERFLREARAVARLAHPNVVQVFEVGAFPVPFFSMELVEGGSLESRLRQGTLLPRDAAALVETLARAMHHAHQKGVVHRDLKPANVLLDADGTPKVTDFGLAKRLDAEQGKTLPGAVMGTPAYMAPEQARGLNDEVGPTADVWALGAVLYECLTGRPPFKGVSPMETLVQVMEAEPLPPSRLAAGAPADLEAVCLKCLEKGPGRRYADAAALADDLARFLRGEPTAARPLGPLRRARKWVRRRPLVAGLTSAFVLSLLAGTCLSLGFAAHASNKAREERAARGRAEAAEQEQAIARREAEQAARSLASGLASVTETFVELGRQQTASGHWLQAAAAFEKACRVVEERLHETDSVPLQAALVRGYTFLGVLRQKAGQPRADEAYRRAAALVGRLAAAKPAELGDRADYGHTCYVLAAALRGRGLATEALTPGRQAVVHLAAALKGSPDNTKLRKATSDAYFELGELQRRAGQPAAAAATALERQKLWPRDANQVYDVACELARCARAVGHGKSILGAAEQADRRRYADLAMAVLKQAIDLGLTDVAGAARDEDLAILRDRPDFRKLLSGGKR